MPNQYDHDMSREQVRYIRSSLKSSRQLADELGLTPSSIRRIRRRKRNA